MRGKPLPLVTHDQRKRRLGQFKDYYEVKQSRMVKSLISRKYYLELPRVSLPGNSLAMLTAAVMRSATAIGPSYPTTITSDNNVICLGIIGRTGVAFETTVRVVKGTGTSLITGHLGKTSEEAVLVALSWADLNLHHIRSWFGKPQSKVPVLAADRDVLIHFANVANLSKIGFSLGAAAATAIVASFLEALDEIELKSGVAISGEVNLRGEVLPVGDIPAKLQGALRAGCTVVIVPESNRSDVEQAKASCTIDAHKQWMQDSVVFAKDMIDVLAAAIEGEENEEEQ